MPSIATIIDYGTGVHAVAKARQHGGEQVAVPITGRGITTPHGRLGLLEDFVPWRP